MHPSCISTLAAPRRISFSSLVVVALLPRVTHTIGCLVGCGSTGVIAITSIKLSPQIPQTRHPLDVQVSIQCLKHSVDARNLNISVEVQFCRRPGDCMRVYQRDTGLCEFAGIAREKCGLVKHDEEIVAVQHTHLPGHIFRGAYDAAIVIRNTSLDLACYRFEGVVVTASNPALMFQDQRDAIVAFAIAAGASRAFGVLFPTFSGGMLPQITGYLTIGIAVGPYVTNLVTFLHIHLIGKWINHLSLAFIAGAAGAEIFYPEFRALIGPIVIQVLLISFFTILICSTGLMALATAHAVPLPAWDMQPSLAGKAALSLLAATMMTARSPASIIGIVQETGTNYLCIAKVAIGITVLGDIVVLTLFAACTSLARVATEGGSFGTEALLHVTITIATSLVLGCVAGQALRVSLPITSEPDVKDDVEEPGQFWKKALTGLRGVLLLGILFGTYQLSDEMGALTNGVLQLEPLLACTTAACICGHDSARRPYLEESLGFWTPYVLLPFFTLAGASLQLTGLQQVLPAATALVALRAVSILVGSSLAGGISRSRYPTLPFTDESVRWTWSTLLSQAGVTLGLVLETKDRFEDWGRVFGTLVIGVVVMNQLLGPVFCRIAIQHIGNSELATKTEEELELTAGKSKLDMGLLPAYTLVPAK